jgi:hypothetical protein
MPLINGQSYSAIDHKVLQEDGLQERPRWAVRPCAKPRDDHNQAKAKLKPWNRVLTQPLSCLMQHSIAHSLLLQLPIV